MNRLLTQATTPRHAQHRNEATSDLKEEPGEQQPPFNLKRHGEHSEERLRELGESVKVIVRPADAPKENLP